MTDAGGSRSDEGGAGVNDPVIDSEKEGRDKGRKEGNNDARRRFLDDTWKKGHRSMPRPQG